MLETRERLHALDFVRVLSMLSVIIIHTSSAYIFAVTDMSFRGLNLAYLLNQAVRYCVPLFFLLSGFSLELSYRAQSYGRFLLTRLKKIVWPYLLWTVVYHCVAQEALAPRILLENIVKGNAAPHLYFMLALAQLYLLYIPLRCCLDRNPIATILVVFALCFFAQWFVYLGTFEVYLLPVWIRPYMTKIFVSWLFPFLLGMLLARSRERWKAVARRYLPLSLPVFVIFSGVYILDAAATGSYDLSIKPLLFLYVPLAFFCFYGLGELFCCVRPLRVCTDALARRSTTIFFCHVLVLENLRKQADFMGMRGMLCLTLLTLVISILLALILDLVWAGVKRCCTPKRGKSDKEVRAE